MATEKVLAPPPVSVPQFPAVQTTSLTNKTDPVKHESPTAPNDTNDDTQNKKATDAPHDPSRSRSPSQRRRSRRRSYSYSRNSRSHSRHSRPSRSRSRDRGYNPDRRERGGRNRYRSRSYSRGRSRSRSRSPRYGRYGGGGGYGGGGRRGGGGRYGGGYSRYNDRDRRGPPRRRYDEKSERFYRGERCFHCGEMGHWARDCPDLDGRGRCFHCGENGHMARSCPSKQRGVPGYRGRAYGMFKRNSFRQRRPSLSWSRSRSGSRERFQE